jgi:uncharacterized protein YjiS (DUF1127 family)
VDKRSLSGALAYYARPASLGSKIKFIAANFVSTHVTVSLSAVWRAILEWERRQRSRQALRSLSNHEIRDFCLDPMEAELEASKPFWRA